MFLETLLIGLVLALVYAEATGLSPGGLIVPGYFALYLDQPPRILATVIVAGACLAVVRLLSRFFLIFGRRRFVLLILLGVCLGQIWFLILPRIFQDPLGLRVIGWVIPGLLAGSMEQQKPLPTLASLAAVSVVTYFIVRAVSGL
jgi:poly-gamma-glutamate biosynthesis protein PgsC/CapC